MGQNNQVWRLENKKERKNFLRKLTAKRFKIYTKGAETHASKFQQDDSRVHIVIKRYPVYTKTPAYYIARLHIDKVYSKHHKVIKNPQKVKRVVKYLNL